MKKPPSRPLTPTADADMTGKVKDVDTLGAADPAFRINSGYNPRYANPTCAKCGATHCDCGDFGTSDDWAMGLY